ncbi:MAG: glycosyltransferase [Dysgonamonadaceae bacterium]|nr:glycosyltransferase [Dysgonamonadaceae bacterium]
MYKVTVAIPVYNVEKYVERALNSALSQTFESVEYILVDDKGTDRSRDIVDAMLKDHPRKKDVRIIEHPANIGTGAVKNTAIEKAQGEFLYFMDSDDEITPDCISTLYNAMAETPVDFVAASHKCKTQNGQLKHLYAKTTYPDKLITGSEHAVAKAFFLEKIPVSIYTWNKLYSVNFLKRNNIKCIPHHLSEDIWFTHQIILRACSCRLLSDVTYFYRETPNSIAGKYNSNKSLPLKAAKTFEEIVTLQTNYATNYKGSIFYSRLILTNYIFAVTYADLIYKSKAIAAKEKSSILRNMLKYPITWRDMIKMNHGGKVALKTYHYANCFMSKAPTVDAKIFLQRVFAILKKCIKCITDKR